MPLTFPLPLSDFQGRFTISSMQLKLPAVTQMSRTAGGAVIKASLGDELWKGSFSIPPTNSRSDAARIDGLISVLDRGGSFLAFHAAKTHPASDPDGSILGASTPSILSLDSNDARMVAIKGLPAGYELIGGDLIGWSDARRNLLDWSEAFDNAVWSKASGATVTSDTDTAPNGTQTADTFTGSTSVANAQVFQSGPQNGTFLYSLYVKKGTSTLTRLGFFSTGGTGWNSIDIGWSSGVPETISSLGSVSNVLYTPTSSGFYRVSFQVTIPDESTSFQINPDRNAAGGTVIAWGAQVEEGPLTAYQKTEDGTEFPDTPNYWLHRIVSDVTADGLGETPQFEVVPFIDPGAAPNMAVALIKPVIKAVMEPDPSYAQDRPVVSSGQSFSFVQTKR